MDSENILYDSEAELDIHRFGHTATIINFNKVVIFGGAKSINELYNDSYIYNIKEKTWLKLNPIGCIPGPRAAHASVCIEKDNMLVFGGASKSGLLASNELYHLKISDEFNSVWNIVPCKKEHRPSKRYGHVMLYNKPYLIVFGGSLKNNQPSNELWILDMSKEELEWKQYYYDNQLKVPQPRVYSSGDICKNGKASGMIIIFGGRDENQDALNDAWGLRRHRNNTWEWLMVPIKNNYVPLKRYQHSCIFVESQMVILGGRGESEPYMPIEIYNLETREWLNYFYLNKFRHSTFTIDKYVFIQGGCDFENPYEASDKIIMFDLVELTNINKKTRKFSNKYSFTFPLEENINKRNLENDPQPIILNTAEIASYNNKNLLIYKKHINLNDFKTIQQSDNEELYEYFITSLLNYNLSRTDSIHEEIPKFRFRKEHIIALTKSCQEIVSTQPIVLNLNTPIKIFGDIHGQYDDLMRFFILWGQPSEEGDINSIDYLFLGDYVDRGVYSLETICLLMALKIKYPERIHLLRGNHEDILINSNFGFLEECQYRIHDDNLNHDISVFKVINEFFEYLPLAAIVDNEIICLHGGIGRCLKYISEIEEIKRPLKITHEANNKTDQIVMDILWSDPTDNDEELGIQQNIMRDSKGFGNIVRFGPDVVSKFLSDNNLSMIIRAHECVLDGFERFSQGNLITLFSATDYCKRHKNAGAMLIIKSNCEIVPHLIYPDNTSNKKWWDNEDSLKKRPPTPLRRKELK